MEIVFSEVWVSSLGEFLIGYVSIYFAIPRWVFRDLKV